ncbi:MAG: selenide, water dikinase SelD [Elainellaceae cyanobacterium]
MKPPSTPLTQDLVLIGGGHSHAIVLKQFAMNPLPGVRLTLITDVSHTPYSGMLPGYVAGLYTFDECHIDLWPLARLAGARLILDRATGLDLAHQRVLCAQHPPIAFDTLSIDIGSTPSTANVEGAEHLIPVKPISKFLARWDALVATLSAQPHRLAAPNPPLKFAVVGGGAGGIELAFAIEGRFQRLHQQSQKAQGIEIHLFQRGDQILPNRSAMMRRAVRRQMRQRPMHLHLGQAVTAIAPAADGASRPLRVLTEGDSLSCDAAFWVTGAAAAPWIVDSGLKTDGQGFIAVNPCLQASHPKVFAAGDVATMLAHPRPKAGVFAVRQGQPLYENLRRSLLGQPLKPFTPQQQFLILVGTGDERAIASRGPVALGPFSLLWRWKDRIDRKFMARFAPGEDGAMALPPRFTPLSPPLLRGETRVLPLSKGKLEGGSQGVAPTAAMHCAGCGAKVGGDALRTALARIQADQPLAVSTQDRASSIVMGLDAAEDAAVLQPPVGQLWVQTVDYFPALIDDPFRLGQITAHHCLNDLWAMGASPHSVLAIATLPYATPAKHEELLYHLLSGLTDVLQKEGAALLGGHTLEGETLALGLTCNGTAPPDRLLKKSGLRPGQSLILTKALGTGTLFAAEQQRRAKGRWIEGAIAAMTQSNAAAAACLQAHGAAACTDITGFGLLGHLLEMATATADAGEPVGLTLKLSALPLLDGAADTIAEGLLSSLQPQNQRAEARLQNRQQVQRLPHYPALFDPQTSGGLLAAVPREKAMSCLAALQQLGYAHSAIVGCVDRPADRPKDKPVRIEA